MAGYLDRIAEGARPLRAQQRPGRPRTPLPGTVRLEPTRPASAHQPGRPSGPAGPDGRAGSDAHADVGSAGSDAGRAGTAHAPEDVPTPVAARSDVVARPDGDAPRGSADRGQVGPAVPVHRESGSTVDGFGSAAMTESSPTVRLLSTPDTSDRMPADRPVYDHTKNTATAGPTGATAAPSETRASAAGPLRDAVADVEPRTSPSPAVIDLTEKYRPVSPAENATATSGSRTGTGRTTPAPDRQDARVPEAPGPRTTKPAPERQDARVPEPSGPRTTDPASALAAWLRSPPTDPDAGPLVRSPGRAAPASKPVTIHIGRVEVTVASPPRRPAAPAAPRAAAAPPPAALALFRLRG